MEVNLVLTYVPLLNSGFQLFESNKMKLFLFAVHTLYVNPTDAYQLLVVAKI